MTAKSRGAADARRGRRSAAFVTLLALLQSVPTERGQLQPAFDQPDSESQLDKPVGNASGQLWFHGGVGVELTEPVELFRCERFIHSRT
jgi:hypothetical protein